MHNFTIFNNRYKSAAFMLIADDEERDYGNTEKAQSLKEKWEQSGYNVISMKNDFRTIYGDEVEKTGAFHWLEEFAEPVNAPAKTETAQAEETQAGTEAPASEQAAAEEAAAAEQNPEEKADVQYVLFLGTNDKDTNKPVFTQAETLERIKDILVRHFGGYTIQEAHGGWESDGKLYQEYTILIYLSDTTLDKVHAAADEMVETFRQSSVLIQENPTKTEFYSGAK